MNFKSMSHAQWRKLHPAEHPLWCRIAVTGGLESCDCDLAYPEVMLSTEPACDCGHASNEHVSIESAPILRACTVEDCGCMDFAPKSGTMTAGATNRNDAKP